MRRIKRSIRRETGKIFDYFKEWRLESDVIDGIEEMILEQWNGLTPSIRFYANVAAIFDAPSSDVRDQLDSSDKKFIEWACTCCHC